MPWEQEPHIASLGGEKNFYLFNTRVKANEDFIKIDENYFKKCVALYILFNEIDKVVTKEAFGGYKANIDYYVLSLISYLSEKKLNLLKIWEDQGIDNVFFPDIFITITCYWDGIRNIIGNIDKNISVFYIIILSRKCLYIGFLCVGVEH